MVPSLVAAALDDLWPRVVEGVSQRWQQAVADPLGALFWTLVWGCAFVATFLFIRMLFTGWGDRNVTEKTLALSLLVHLLVAMLSTTVMLVREPDPPTETRTPLRRVTVPNTRTSEQGGGATGQATGPGRAGPRPDAEWPGTGDRAPPVCQPDGRGVASSRPADRDAARNPTPGPRN